MIAEDVCVKRPNQKYSIYKMVSHYPSIKNPIRNNLLFSSVMRMNSDGLKNLNTLNISIVFFKNLSLFSLLKINVGEITKNYFKTVKQPFY